MRYLISGHPRTRTAWLCALLNAHHSLCYHDALLHQVPFDVDAGIADPSLACVAPLELSLKYSEGKPRICLVRGDWDEALAKWSRMTLNSETVEQMNDACEEFAANADLVLHYSALDDDEVVKDIVQRCTHEPASATLIEIFQGLSVEQHLEKAQCVWSQLLSARHGVSSG